MDGGLEGEWSEFTECMDFMEISAGPWEPEARDPYLRQNGSSQTTYLPCACLFDRSTCYWGCWGARPAVCKRRMAGVLS